MRSSTDEISGRERLAQFVNRVLVALLVIAACLWALCSVRFGVGVLLRVCPAIGPAFSPHSICRKFGTESQGRDTVSACQSDRRN
jgi:hypothetical protein